MRHFTDLVHRLSTPGTDRAAALAGYLRQAPAADAAAALALLAGQTPKRRATPARLRALAQGAANIPDALFAACLAQTRDAAETIALLIPPPLQPTHPGLADTLARLHAITTPADIAALWDTLLPSERGLANRLITGMFRTRIDAETLSRARLILSGSPLADPARGLQIRTILTYAEAAGGPAGPELTLALWHEGVPVPVARARAVLPQADLRDLLAWVRAHSQERFGPLHRVPATQVIALDYGGITPNSRRKSGVTLINPRILQWLRDADPAEAHHISDLPLAGPAPLPLDET